MKRLARKVQGVLVSLACLSWLLPVPEVAAGSPPAAGGAAQTIVDVRLHTDGTLSGKLVDGTGQPLREQRLALQQKGEVVGRTTSDDAGDFAFPRVRAGVSQIVLTNTAVTCRVWTREAAPPAAGERLVIVEDATGVRGQQPIGAIFTNPLFIGAVVAAAIAIPIAVHNAQDDKPAGS